MKTINTLWVFTLLAIAGCTHVNNTPSQSTELSLLVDITDPLPLFPTSESITGYLGIKEDMYKEVTVHISTIADVPNTSETIITLEPANNLLVNKNIRQSKVSAFTKKLNETLENLRPHDTATKPRSVVFIKLLTTLEKLCKSTAFNRHLIVYSNLMQNDGVSFFNPQTLSLLKRNPEKLTQALLQNDTIPNLKGIVIHFMHQPKDYAEGQTYATVSDFFKQLFEKHGATVHISAGRNHQAF